MKKIILVGIVVMGVTACEKLGLKKDKPCAQLSSEAVPESVKGSFTQKYPDATVTTWFNKDNGGFSALFTQNGNQTLVQFNNDGKFVKEEIDNDDEDNDKDDDKGCSCGSDEED